MASHLFTVWGRRPAAGEEETKYNQGRLEWQEASPELELVMWCTDAPSSGEIGKSLSISYNTLAQSHQLTVVYQSCYLAAALHAYYICCKSMWQLLSIQSTLLWCCSSGLIPALVWFLYLNFFFLISSIETPSPHQSSTTVPSLDPLESQSTSKHSETNNSASKDQKPRVLSEGKYMLIPYNHVVLKVYTVLKWSQ